MSAMAPISSNDSSPNCARLGGLLGLRGLSVELSYAMLTSFLLPKGTRIDVSIAYDNSTDNPRNPSNPPKRAQFGEESFDEMGAIALMVTAVRADDEAALQKALADQAQEAIKKGAADGTAKRYLEHQASRRPPAVAPRS